MKSLLFYFLFIISFQWVFSQDIIEKELDSLYKEDQFYAGITYNLIGNKPNGLSQSGFSTGLLFGFIKDMPINSRRNVAIGLGVGYSANSYNQNLLLSKDSAGNTLYSILTDSKTFTKNKFSLHRIEMPLEFRWRTSTPSEYNFWRIYTGFKLGYLIAHTTKYNGDLGSLKYSDIDDFNKLQYGLTLSVGYNTWNLHLYYGLNPIFSNEAKLSGESINMNAIKIGLIFYIL